MENVNDKYLDILEKGRELFWKYGIKRVTVEEICSEADTSRVTFYRYFDNKEDLAATILKNLLSDAISEYRAIMESDISFTRKAEETILFKIRNSESMSHEFLNDVVSGDFPKVLEIITKAREDSMQMVVDDYTRAQQQGLIRKDVKIEFILYLLNKMQEMTADPELEKLYPDSGKLIKEMIEFFFFGLIPCDLRKD